MNYLYLMSLVVVAGSCFFAIISHKFHDNLLQRIALSGIILVCCASISQIIRSEVLCNFELFIILIAIYSLATIWKLQDGRDKAK